MFSLAERRARQHQIADKIGHPDGPPSAAAPSYLGAPQSYGSNNELPPRGRSAEPPGGNGAFAGGYAAGVSLAVMSPSFGGGGQQPQQQQQGGYALPPAFGRRARSSGANAPDDRDKAERLLAYQTELRAQADAERARKEQERQRRKQEDLELDQRVRRDLDLVREREIADIQREKATIDAAAEAALTGGKKGRRAAAGGGNAVAPAAVLAAISNAGGLGAPTPLSRPPLAPTAGVGGQQGGRKHDPNAPPASSNESEKQRRYESYLAELEEQRQAVTDRKRKEAEKTAAEERAFNERMERWAASDGPLGMQPQPAARRGGGPATGGIAPLGELPATGEGGSGPQSHRSVGGAPAEDAQQHGGLPWDVAAAAGPQPTGDAAGMGFYGYGAAGGAGGGVPMAGQGPAPGGLYPQSGSADVQVLRDEIMTMLLEQRRTLQDLVVQGRTPIAATQSIPIPVNITAPPPAHRAGYSGGGPAYLTSSSPLAAAGGPAGVLLLPQPGALPVGPYRPGRGGGGEGPTGGGSSGRDEASGGGALLPGPRPVLLDNPQDLLDRFLREDDVRASQGFSPATQLPPQYSTDPAVAPAHSPDVQRYGRGGALMNSAHSLADDSEMVGRAGHGGLLGSVKEPAGAPGSDESAELVSDPSHFVVLPTPRKVYLK